VPAISIANTGRNSPCPCGSGKRFKDCCGALGEAGASPSQAAASGNTSADEWAGPTGETLRELATKMQEALHLQTTGKHEAAADLYRDVLRVVPSTHDALHMLGVIEHLLGNAPEAVQLIDAAMALRPAYGAIVRNRELAVAAVVLRNGTEGDAQCRERIATFVRDDRKVGHAPAEPALGAMAPSRSADGPQVFAEAGTVAAQEDMDWLARRLRDILPTAHGSTPPRGGVLVVIGRTIPNQAWLNASQPARVLLWCLNGALSDYAGPIEALHVGTGLSVELVYRSEADRSRFGLPGHVLIPPVALPEPFDPAIGAPRRDDGFVVGHISPRAESVLPRARPTLWLQLARAGGRVVLYGANRLRYLVGSNPDIEVCSRQLESLPAFLARLDCLVYDATPCTGEDWGRELFGAMAMGIPVLCSGRSCFAEYIEHGRTGYIYRHEMDAVRIAMELRANPAKATEVGVAARAWSVAALSSAAMEHRYRAVFCPQG
jgi:hypothetical protein